MTDRHAELIAALEASPPHRGSENAGKRAIQCPAAGHEDRDPSARYAVQPDGTVLLFCWSRGCSFADMLNGLGGFEPADAFPPGSRHVNGHAPSIPKARAPKPAPLPEPDRWARVASWQARYAASPDVPGPLHVRQEARNADGSPVMDPRKGKPRKRVAWPFGTIVNDLALYGSWELPADGPVVICEGEKAADAVRAAGFAAVGTYGSGYTASAAATEPVRGRDVVVWPDADAPGREHMDGLAHRLTGVAASVRIVEPPEDVPLGWDAADADAATIGRLLSDAPLAQPPEPKREHLQSPDDRHDGAAEPDRGKASAADRIVELATAHYDFARADDGEPFAIDRDGPNVAHLFRGGRASLRAALATAYNVRFRKVPPAQALVDALAVLEGQALSAPRRRLPLRAGRLEDGSVVMDLADEQGRAVIVTPQGWQLVPRSPVTFRRSELTAALPCPISDTGSLDRLYGLLNMDVEDRPIVVAHLVAALLGVPVPIILLRGPAGVAKTTAAKLLAGSIDPSPAPVRAVPRDPEGWAVAASGSYVVALDNISGMPDWLSDVLCRSVTGEGVVRRALYTDNSISVVAFRRALFLTGIDPGALRGDLADRLYAVDLAPIAEEQRRDDAEVDAAFRAAHPAILGGLLDLTARVLATLPTIRLARRPRMADYARVLATVDAILGTAGLARYMEQRGELQRDAAEGDRIGAAILKLTETHAIWTGSARDLLDALTPERPPKDWPATPRALAGSLRRVAQPLAAAGVVVTFGRESGSGGRRLITLTRTEARTTVAPSQPSQPSTDGSDDRGDHSDGRGDDGRSLRPVPEHERDGSDGSDHVFPSLLGRYADVEADYPASAWNVEEVPA